MNIHCYNIFTVQFRCNDEIYTKDKMLSMSFVVISIEDRRIDNDYIVYIEAQSPPAPLPLSYGEQRETLAPVNVD